MVVVLRWITAFLITSGLSQIVRRLVLRIYSFFKYLLKAAILWVSFFPLKN